MVVEFNDNEFLQWKQNTDPTCDKRKHINCLIEFLDALKITVERLDG